MKKLLLSSLFAGVVLLNVAPAALGNDYQLIGSDSVIWGYGTSFYENDIWNQNAPWAGTPAENQPGLGDTLNLARESGGSLILFSSDEGFKDYKFGQLTVDGDAGGVPQVIRGQGNTLAHFAPNEISVSGNASLMLYRANGTARILVSASSVSVAQGSTLYLGNDDLTSSSSNAVDGFQVTGQTTINGTLNGHFQNRVATGSFHLGDLQMGAAGKFHLMNLVVIAPTGNEITMEYAARSLAGSGSIYALAAPAPNIRTLTATLRLDTEASSDATFSGVLATIASGNPQNARLALAVSGSGRQTLTGTNTYTGATTLSGGTLILAESGSINTTSGITLDGGGLIQNSTTALTAPVTWQAGEVGGLGTITGDLTASGAGTKRLTPGDDGLGTLTVTGGLTLDANTTVQFTLNGLTAGTDYNILSVGGTFALHDAVLDLNLGFTVAMDDEFTIANFESRNGTFAGLADEALFNVGNTTFQINYNTQDITLQVVAIPEPGATGLLGLAALAAGGALLRKRSQRTG